MKKDVDLINLLSNAFQESGFADNNVFYNDLLTAEQNLTKSLTPQQQKLFADYQLCFDSFVFEEERALIEFILKFLKQLTK